MYFAHKQILLAPHMRNATGSEVFFVNIPKSSICKLFLIIHTIVYSIL